LATSPTEKPRVNIAIGLIPLLAALGLVPGFATLCDHVEVGNAMSLLTMASVAIARDLGAPGEPLAKAAIHGQLAGPPAEQAAGQPDGGGGAPAGSIAGFAQLLVAQIPGEALLAYTTLLALFAVGGVSFLSWHVPRTSAELVPAQRSHRSNPISRSLPL
jgi:hypothetical protein